ncbi:hypothetical protein AcV5_002215 [Taiwanofungus camphoratus]|nr:hypothetical protein AcV5_002215 [Antrodia cinnamomea]
MSGRNRSALRKDASIASAHSKSLSVRQGSSERKEDTDDTEPQVEDLRNAWIQQRQAELERIFDNHDNLVREAFHLEKFVTLLSYDPKVAKADNSAVFREYQASHDLLSQSTSASSSRRTRRAQTERLQLLKGPALALLPPSQSKRGKKSEANKESDNAFWTILAEAKSKGKKAVAGADSTVEPTLDCKGKGKAKGFDEEVPGQAMRDISEGIPASDMSSSSFWPRPQPRVSNGMSVSANGYSQQPPRKRRRLEPSVSSSSAVGSYASAMTNGLDSQNIPESTSAIFSKRPSGRAREARLTESLSALPDPGVLPLSPTKSAVKRVKLIVRRPQPTLSHPCQKPPPPKYGESLTAFLSSYHVLDGNEVNLETLEQQALKAAGFWEKVDLLRRQGRLLSLNETSGDALGTSSRENAPECRDPWWYIVEAIKARALSRPVSGQQIAAQVANRIRAYWDTQTAREDKVKLQEEKRLKALAKATTKMVVAEWKKAVFHVREQERLRHEAEERRRGHEHLDAILDQSGQILEAQQYDLSKATSRSRSSSVSATFRLWASASPGPDGSSSETEESVDESTEQEQDGNDDEGLDSSLLLGQVDLPPNLSHKSLEDGTNYSVSRSLNATISPEDFSTRSESAGSPVPSDEFTDQLPFMDVGMVNSSHEPSEQPDSSFPPCSPKSPELAATLSTVQGLDYYQGPHVANIDRAANDDDISSSLVLFSPAHDIHSKDSSGVRVDGAMMRNEPLTALPSLSGPELPEVQEEFHLRKAPQAVLALILPNYETKPESHTQETEAVVNTDGQPPSVNDQSGSILPQHDIPEGDIEEDVSIPFYLRPYAVIPVEWDLQSKVKAPFLLRGNLRPYQQAGLEWLASLHTSNLNGILADEMGLGKTIQTISLLAHLACDRGIWGPHLIIVPTSVLLNWEMEFKKFLPGFKVLSYHGNSKRRKELRQGWYNKYHFNVCVTSYTLASRDAHVFKRKPWYYMILDEAHMIKNFKSQRWNILLMFRSFRRLLLTGTPLQNNLTELWALLQFLMSGTNFANLKEFGEWFSNPLEKAIEMGTIDDETQQRVSKLHTVLRPYLLRRLKRDVEKELPQKFEHLIMCPLSKRQRFLYDEFMTRADTRHDLQSGVYQKIANILMQLRKVVNHPDLFEVRPIRTSFAMERSAIAEFEIKELMLRRRFCEDSECRLDLDILGLQFIHQQNTSVISALETNRLEATSYLPMISELPGEPPPQDLRTVEGYKRFRAFQQRAARIARWAHIGYLNRLRCSRFPLYGKEMINIVRRLYQPLQPVLNRAIQYLNTVDRISLAVKSYTIRAEDMADTIDKFAFVTPSVVARDLPRIALFGSEAVLQNILYDPEFDAVLHRISVKLQIAFPDPSLLQYDCGKLQELARLLRERKAGGHRVLIFTQMTRILDILEIFLNLHGYLYLRLDGATKIEDRQYITERFNSDQRIFCFISSSRSGGVGINLTGADTVIFYDSDFNPQMDRQCEDRAHRIGQIRDVHIYRFVSQHTVEEALLRKANQKRHLDDLVIQKGEFDWRSLFSDEGALTKALGEFEDTEDAHAAAVAASEEVAMEGADAADFTWEGGAEGGTPNTPVEVEAKDVKDMEAVPSLDNAVIGEDEDLQVPEEDDDDGGTTVDYMLTFVRFDMEFFSDWRV